MIELTERIDADWLRGRLKDQEGMFPQVFVEVRVDIPVEVPKDSESKPEEGVATALFEFEGQSEEELTFKVKRSESVLYMMCYIHTCTVYLYISTYMYIRPLGW